jgi:hypothetical protein
MSINTPLLPFLAFLCVRTGEYRSVVVDTLYLTGRHAVLLPRFALVGEDDVAGAIGLEYGQAVEFRGDLVIGTTEQLGRLRSLFESFRTEEANDCEAIDFWESLIRPLNAAIGIAPFVGPDPSICIEGWFTWHSSSERFESLPLG